MKRLGIIDAAFINMENPTVPQQIGSLGIYDPSTAPGGFVRFKDVLANFERRLQRMPLFRTRLVEVPFGLDRPYWVLDPAFDVEFHIRHIALPHPGDWRQLCIQVARLHARALDMSRPLWEVYVIEGVDRIPGLPAGSFAVYVKVHHSMIDGSGGQNFMAAVHDLEPSPPEHASLLPTSPPLPDVSATDVHLLGRTLLNALPDTVARVRATVDVAGRLTRMALKMARNELPPAQMQGPKTRFDQPVGPNRVFEARLFDIEDLKALKNAAGMTLNDVAVAIVSGALRKYLLTHNELPEEALLGSMPVNMRTRVGETGDNNQVGAMTAKIHTEIADPIARLHAIKKSLDEAKAYIDTPLVEMSKVMGMLPPLLSKPIASTYVRNQLTRLMPIGVATVITNVMGPPFPVYCAGAQLVRFYPLGLLNPGLGLFHAVFSMSGKVSITVTADRDQMPDPEFYGECITASYEELRDALIPKPAPPRPAASAARAARRRSGFSRTMFG
ncbi:MAG: wax ester/triacylglycerol synthase family O-acyltransferase [Pseudomonadales bacterium]|nr:wax ester/triacylglycerol synthase family O-acyltransferase [Pseudomonadales bacterium]